MQRTWRAERADALFAPGVDALGLQRHPFRLRPSCAWPAAGETPELGACPEINHGPNLGTDVFYSGHRFGGDGGTLEGLRARR